MDYKLFSPENIPLYYYYFGWRKAKTHAMEQGFNDPIEIKEFEIEIEKNIIQIQKDFKSGLYQMQKPLLYAFPKGADGDTLKLRPMSKISFRDQVAWATVVLVLGEWFDTNKVVLVQGTNSNEKAEDAMWMLDWSCNNRLRRKYDQKNHVQSKDTELRRVMINVTSNTIYESFQRSLRTQRKLQEKYYEEIFHKHTHAYYGQVDIAKFYPSLRMKVIFDVVKSRLTKLTERSVITKEEEERWTGLLNSMCTIETDFDMIQPEEMRAIGLDKETLRNALPTGLISAGFLANCVLTHYLDQPLEKSRTRNEKKGKQVFFTRYTDDITIVSSDKDLVEWYIRLIGRLLNGIGLRLSKEKMIPKLKRDAIKEFRDKLPERVRNELGNDDILELLGPDEFKCPRVSKYDTLPKSTSIIDKISHLGDQNVRVMNRKEIGDHVQEVLELVTTEFSPEEIRDDTKTTFAAWKLKKAAMELKDRGESSNDITKELERAYMKYPYKLSLLSCYVLHLLSGADKMAKSHFTSLLKKVKKSREDLTIPGFYGSFIRTHLLFSIADHWYLVNDDEREDFRRLLLDEISEWFKDEKPTWHETYGVYWLFASTQIPVELQIYSVGENPIIDRAVYLYRSIMKKEETNYGPSIVSAARERWKKTLSRQREIGENNSREIEWLDWVWKNVEEEKWSWSIADYGRVWIEISSGYVEKLKSFGFKKLIEMAENYLDMPTVSEFLSYQSASIGDQDLISEYLPVYNGVMELLDQGVTLWASKENRSLADALNEMKKPPSEICKSLQGRLESLKTIEQIFLKSDKSQRGKLPALQVKTSPQVISLQDWIEMVQLIPQWFEFEETPPELQSLTELEITYLVYKVAEQIKNDVTCRTKPGFVSLNRIGFTVQEWIDWRRDVENLSFRFINDSGISEWYITAWAYTHANFVDDEFQLCYALSMLLFRLISGKQFWSRAFGIMRLRGWRNISSVLEQARYPSTTIAELIAGSLNYPRSFYEQYYSKSIKGMALLPLEKMPVVKVDEYCEILQQHYELLRRSTFIGDTGLREVRVIDLRKVTKEGN